MEFLRNVSAIASHMVKSFYKKATKSFEDSVIACMLSFTAGALPLLVWAIISPSTAIFGFVLTSLVALTFPVSFLFKFFPQGITFINDLGRELRNLPPKELDNR